MKIYKLNPDSTTEKTVIFYARYKDYQFKLTDQDGTATVTNSKGETYHINDWQCDCADSMNRDGGSYTLGNTERRACKHTIYLSQMYPCPNCKGFMVLRTEAWKVYQCCTSGCYTMTPFQLVKAQRQQAYRLAEQEADVLKTHAPTNTDAILAKAEEASHAIFSGAPAKPK
jgi:hypothetical protein